jgi:pimeloyl-ACP methyl ester carboxylesterase
MRIVERGSGPPLVLIPGLQGRWEYARVTIEALARHFRVLSFSLADEPSADAPFDAAAGIDGLGDQVGHALDAQGLSRAVICGISFGGLVALNFASRFPSRTTALVLTSTPGPGMRLRRKHEIYTRIPWLFGPVFMIEAPFRARRELKASLPRFRDRVAMYGTMMAAGVRAPLSPSRMAGRAQMIASYDAAEACRRIVSPTLVVTGEPGLDYVVSVDGSSEYARLIRGAERAVLERTGHQGTLTRPDAYADLVQSFVARHHHAAA